MNTEEQIISILKEQEAGASVAELCRKHGMSDATFYKWKKQIRGLEVSEAKRLRAIEDPLMRKPTPIPPDSRPNEAIVYPHVGQNVKHFCASW
jgi:hypothetical protein